MLIVVNQQTDQWVVMTVEIITNEGVSIVHSCVVLTVQQGQDTKQEQSTTRQDNPEFGLKIMSFRIQGETTTLEDCSWHPECRL